MPFTSQLGTDDSQLGNIVLGGGSAVPLVFARDESTCTAGALEASVVSAIARAQGSVIVIRRDRSTV